MKIQLKHRVGVLFGLLVWQGGLFSAGEVKLPALPTVTLFFQAGDQIEGEGVTLAIEIRNVTGQPITVARDSHLTQTLLPEEKFGEMNIKSRDPPFNAGDQYQVVIHLKGKPSGRDMGIQSFSLFPTGQTSVGIEHGSAKVGTCRIGNLTGVAPPYTVRVSLEQGGREVYSTAEYEVAFKAAPGGAAVGGK